MASSNTRAFVLEHDPSHLMDYEYDVTYIDQAECTGLRASLMSQNPSYIIPERIMARGNFNLLPKLDFPICNFCDLVVSRKMWRVLTRIQTMKCNLIETIIVDDTFLDHPLDQFGEPLPQVATSADYVCVHLTGPPVSASLQHSDYFPHPRLESHVGFFTREVIEVPTKGLPPLARLEQFVPTVIVSEDAKQSLEKASISGCVFREVETVPAER